MRTTNGSALTYRFAEGGGYVSVAWASHDYVERRDTYRWTVTTLDHVEWSGEDLRGGTGEAVDLPAMLASLLSFLGAFAEARQYGTEESDNWGLFPDGLSEWAVAVGDGFALAAEELEPSGEES